MIPYEIFINSKELLLGITTRIYFPSLRIMVRIIVFTDLDDTGNLSGPGPSVWCLYMYKMRV